jgi:hypothetical protein
MLKRKQQAHFFASFSLQIFRFEAKIQNVLASFLFPTFFASFSITNFCFASSLKVIRGKKVAYPNKTEQ